MRNMRVTRDGNLQKRPGTRAVLEIDDEHGIDAVWTGTIGGEEAVMAICGGSLYSCWDGSKWEAELIGSLGSIDRPFMFGFSEHLYILTGYKYYRYNGTTLAEVDGYVPLVAVAVPPAGGGELLEQHLHELVFHLGIHEGPVVEEVVDHRHHELGIRARGGLLGGALVLREELGLGALHLVVR